MWHYLILYCSSIEHLLLLKIRIEIYLWLLQYWAHHYSTYCSDNSWVLGLPVWETHSCHLDRHELLRWGLERGITFKQVISYWTYIFMFRVRYIYTCSILILTMLVFQDNLSPVISAGLRHKLFELQASPSWGMS